MVDYTYTYLVWVFIFLFIWIILFLLRKDVRKEMLFVSLLFGFAGIITELTHIRDWWQPITITGTAIGFEDFLMGFFVGGVASVIYEEIFKKKVVIRKSSKKREKSNNINLLLMIAILTFVFFFLFFGLNIHSFYSLLISIGLALSYIYFGRSDLIVDSLFSGVLMLVVGSSSYLLLNLLYPGFIYEFWFLDDGLWFSDLFFGVPVAEYIWWFFAGAYIGPLYEFWKRGRIVKE